MQNSQTIAYQFTRNLRKHNFFYSSPSQRPCQNILPEPSKERTSRKKAQKSSLESVNKNLLSLGTVLPPPTVYNDESPSCAARAGALEHNQSESPRASDASCSRRVSRSCLVRRRRRQRRGEEEVGYDDNDCTANVHPQEYTPRTLCARLLPPSTLRRARCSRRARRARAYMPPLCRLSPGG